MSYYDKQEQHLPLITPDMFRELPDQTCDILNKLIRFYEQYRDDSYNAIVNNTATITIADDVVNAIQTDLTNIHTELANLATVARTGSYNDLLNKPTIPVITMQTTDPGEGQPLAADHYIAVYQ